ncbi:MAG: acyl-CoA reductase, partial [Patiriisocius sp.]
MNLQQRIDAFVKLGSFLGQFVSPLEDHTTAAQAKVSSNDSSGVDNAIFYEKMIQTLQDAHHQNTWFTYDNLAFSCKSWSEALTQENLTNWVSNYTISEVDTPKTIAIVMAGNIPLVGFHDFLSVLLCGHKLQAKLSSNDKKLLPFLASYLC